MEITNFNKIDLKIFFETIKSHLTVFEQNFKIKCLCGQIGGGRAMGFSGMVSDNDLDVFYRALTPKRPERKLKQIVAIKNISIEVEFNFIEINDLINESRIAFNNIYEKYPSIFYRTEDEVKKYSPENIKPRGEREDYYATKMHWFIMGDIIWLSDRYNKDIYMQLAKTEPIIYALDYYFTRAYGNMNQYINKKEYVNVRRYLNCIWQILSCEWILRYKFCPPNDFVKLTNALVEYDIVKEKIFRILYTNCNSYIDKSELYMKTDEDINDYICKLLDEQRKQIEEYDKSKKIEDLYKATPDEFKKSFFIVDL